MPERIVIALGGNALQSKDSAPTAQAQLEVVRRTCGYIAQISQRGYEMAIVHGNGPQVGRIMLASETAREVVPPMPFDVCGAMSQGYIGYHIQQSLKYALSTLGKAYPVVTLATQVVVDRQDPAFQAPTKPIGAFYSREEAETLEREKGYTMREDAGRGWRRVVPSPVPRRIVEIGAVRLLWDHAIVITCGGGGIPVVEAPDGTLEGVAAVIDKDLAAELLAEEVGADVLLRLDGGGKGGGALWEARPAGPGPSEPCGGRPVRCGGAVRRREHVAQGGGGDALCPGRPQQAGHHHQPGPLPGRVGRKDRYGGDFCLRRPGG